MPSLNLIFGYYRFDKPIQIKLIIFRYYRFGKPIELAMNVEKFTLTKIAVPSILQIKYLFYVCSFIFKFSLYYYFHFQGEEESWSMGGRAAGGGGLVVPGGSGKGKKGQTEVEVIRDWFVNIFQPVEKTADLVSLHFKCIDACSGFKSGQWTVFGVIIYNY
jgi:hypothetical protein